MATIDHARPTGSPFRNLYICFALLIPATLLAFANSYFAGVTFSGKPVTVLIHLHAALMALWLLMLIAQAWFIRTNRLRLHRWVGRSSFVIAPLIILEALVADYKLLNLAAITPEDAQIEVFTWGQLLAFGVTWGLAMVYRKQTSLHVRFIVSTGFAIGTAIVLRILLAWVPGLDDLDRGAAVNWTLLTLALLALIAADWRRGMKCSPFWVVTVLIGVMHVGYWTFAKTDGWRAFIEWYAEL